MKHRDTMLWRRRRRDGFVWKKHVKTIVVERRARRVARAEAFAEAGARHAGHAKAAARNGARAAASRLKQAGSAIGASAGNLFAAARRKLPRARPDLGPIKSRIRTPDLSRLSKHAKDPMSLLQAGTYVLLAVGAVFAVGALISKDDAPTAVATEQQSTGGSLFSLFSSTQIVTGRATSLSGDMLRLDDHTIRLRGIDAPEMTQRCRNQRGRSWRCGSTAQRHLARLLRQTTVSCTIDNGPPDTIRTGTCTANGADISIALLERGRAFASDDADAAQATAAEQAKRDGRGIWSGKTEHPDTYRKRLWDRAVSRAPGGCPIKAVLRGGARIYLTPWDAGYDARRVRTSRGDQWFCSEDAAMAKGWRPA